MHQIGPDFIGSFNTRGVNSLFNEDFGTVVFDIFFGTPVDAVAFNFGASDDLWRLSAFDSGGNLLESIDINPIPNSNAGDFFGIAADGIANVELFTVDGGLDFVFIDNFTFNTRGGTAVPEPGTLALFGIGLAGLALVRRRKAVKSLTI